MIRWNDWDVLEPNADPVPVSIIVPARSTQAQLDLFLKMLEIQDYPTDLLEVIVVDHRSSIPLSAPADSSLNIHVVRHDDGYGPGAARRLGAERATNGVLLFLDVDIVVSRQMIKNYVRWPSGNALAVGLGFRNFIAQESVAGTAFEHAVEAGELEEHFRRGTATEGQEWIDNYLQKCADARSWRDDLWIVVVGAGIAVSRRLYDYAGGFRDFETHGVEDTEFGYRLFQAGGIIVPDRAAVGYHVGLRTISRERESINWNRAGALANAIPHRRYRPRLAGRGWTVPSIVVQIPISENEEIVGAIRTVDDLLATPGPDLGIAIQVAADLDLLVLREYFAGDPRVVFTHNVQLEVPISTSLIVRVRPGLRFVSGSFVSALKKWDLAAVGIACFVVGSDDVSMEIWRTAALARAVFEVGDDSHAVRDYVREAFGEEWFAGSDIGLSYELGAASSAYKDSNVPAAVYYS
jgi:GT2 family glycosyltransferase